MYLRGAQWRDAKDVTIVIITMRLRRRAMCIGR
jgi:hypothetical protein